LCGQFSDGATVSGRVRRPSKIHGGSAEQMPYVPSYQYPSELRKLYSTSGQSQATQSATLRRLRHQRWVAVGTLAKIILQLLSSKVSDAPYDLVFPVRVTGLFTKSTVVFVFSSSIFSTLSATKTVAVFSNKGKNYLLTNALYFIK
jgi:hypothetical protein